MTVGVGRTVILWSTSSTEIISPGPRVYHGSLAMTWRDWVETNDERENKLTY